MKISTAFVYPPIPDRRFDWSAVDDDTYDGAEDSSTRGQMLPAPRSKAKPSS